MKLSIKARRNFFHQLAELLEKCRKEKGWDMGYAARYNGISLRRFIQYEYAAGGSLGNIQLAQLMNLLAGYGKGLKISLFDLEESDYDESDTEEIHREAVLNQMSPEEKAYIEARLKS